MALQKTNFNTLSRFNNSPFILFGSGNIAGKTLRNLKPETVECIIDNSTSLQGGKYQDKNILSPSDVDFSGKKILICSTAITDISAQLDDFGLIENVDYFISPILNDLLAISALESLQSTFYFTSGTAVSNSKEYGGGFYSCTVDKSNVSLKKIHSGPCYGAERVGEKIYFVDTDNGIHCYDGIKVKFVCDVPSGARAHGISYNEDNSNFYVTCSYRDSVLEYDSNFELLREFSLSSKLETMNEPAHHCNDNCAVGNSLFVTMFSSTGNWKLDKFDGCIAEFDINSGQRLPDVETNLYMPHNIKIINGSIHVLDSLPGHLRFNNLAVQGTFPAFTRGLGYSNGLYYVGQSKNRNFSRVIGLSNNVSIDCGIIVYDPELKVSRFLQLPYAIGEVHTIVT
jgi:hypothetical protein